MANSNNQKLNKNLSEMSIMTIGNHSYFTAQSAQLLEEEHRQILTQLNALRGQAEQIVLRIQTYHEKIKATSQEDYSKRLSLLIQLGVERDHLLSISDQVDELYSQIYPYLMA